MPRKKIEVKRLGQTKQQAQSAEDWVSDRENVRNFQIYIPSNLHKKLKIEAIKSNKTMKDLAVEVFKAYFDEGKK